MVLVNRLQMTPSMGQAAMEVGVGREQWLVWVFLPGWKCISQNYVFPLLGPCLTLDRAYWACARSKLAWVFTAPCWIVSVGNGWEVNVLKTCSSSRKSEHQDRPINELILKLEIRT